jgi:hypothetical protein
MTIYYSQGETAQEPNEQIKRASLKPTVTPIRNGSKAEDNWF